MFTKMLQQKLLSLQRRTEGCEPVKFIPVWPNSRMRLNARKIAREKDKMTEEEGEEGRATCYMQREASVKLVRMRAISHAKLCSLTW